MPYYRKIPIVIEARLFDAGLDYDGACEVVKWCGGYATSEGCIIATLEGNMTANNGDYIIKGVAGEFYPCKPQIFEKTYEAA